MKALTEELVSERWGYALISGGVVLATWSVDGVVGCEAALEEGTRRVLATGDDEAYYQVIGRVDTATYKA